MFIGRLKTYKKQCSSVTYALSFLWDPAWDHFALLINEANNTRIVPLIFKNWSLFKVELTQNFRPINPMVDTKSAINKLSLAEDGKAIKYFVDFNKYKTRTRFNDWSYYILVMNQMPMHILHRISECIPPPADYETLWALILLIDAQYWNFKEIESNHKKALGLNHNSSGSSSKTSGSLSNKNNDNNNNNSDGSNNNSGSKSNNNPYQNSNSGKNNAGKKNTSNGQS